MQLTHVIDRIQPLAVVGQEGGRVVSGVVFDSRKATKNSLFVAVRGTQVDGHDYIDRAIANGATVIVCEEIPVGADAGAGEGDGAKLTQTEETHSPTPPHGGGAMDDADASLDHPYPDELISAKSDQSHQNFPEENQKAPSPVGRAGEGICYAQVENSAQALALIASEFYGNPSKKLTLVGVTGTNGKTTVTTLLHDLFTKLGYKTGLLSTVEVRIGTTVVEATHTTPDAIAINAHLADMVASGCDYAFMEVSSHAVAQHRTRGLAFNGGVFTNLSHDHLDYHKTFAAYRDAKKAFFDQLPQEAFALTNADDRNGDIMLQNTAARRRAYSLRKMVDFRAKVLSNSPQGLQLEIDGTEVFTRLIGRFNAYNLLAAYGVATELGQDKEEVLVALSSLGTAAGRLDYVSDPSGAITAVVDYAHTPDALRNVLETLAEVMPPGGRLVCVVGAGGDRDRTKRPEMARLAAALADQVILTSDNPRGENPETILDEMQAGLVSAEHRAKSLRITDRRSAIRTAVQLAQPGDLVLVAGKGHETYQEIKGERFPFDDKLELTNALNARAHVG